MTIAETYTPGTALVGGALIGLAAAALLVLSGRMAGISGILAGLLPPDKGDAAWRLWFFAGLVGGTVLYRAVTDQGSEALVFEASYPLIVVGGLLAGIGTRVSGGCTSGHGVCGIGRLSPRSIVATCTFIFTGAVTVYVSRHLLGV
jgi:uncharacterized membrane protein YedE/YeeE